MKTKSIHAALNHSVQSSQSNSATNPDLPVLAFESEIKDLIKNHPVSIIIGETGSGKTTEIGRMMHDVIGGKIVTTQPRRPAAITVAEYVAYKHHGQEVGGNVGYHIRFNDTTHRGSILDYVTDGILIEQLLATKTLPDYDGVILDEAHIRNLNVDFLMGLISGVNRLRSESGMSQLKILITSATIPAEKFSDFFGGAPVLQIPGRMFPVETVYQKQPKNYIDAIVGKIQQVEQQGIEGDILVFVPGEAEIRRTLGAIRGAGLAGNLELLPFYGQQSVAEQEKVFMKYSKRKVVVATNVAETSLTIDGVRVVIDVGLQRSSIFDHHTGISRLEDEPASIAAINQRRGRAGRTAPGVCFRLYPKELERPEYDVPEIMRTDLAGTVLKMKRLGIENILGFDFIDPPSKANLRKAIHTLKMLGALDERERITKVGQFMANLPLDPHISRMVEEASRLGCVDPICTVAAFMSSKSPFDRSGPELEAAEAAHERFKVDGRGQPQSDPQTYLKIWNAYSVNQENPDWVTKNYLNPKVLQEVSLIREDLLQTLKRSQVPLGDNHDPISIAKSITAGMISNLLEKFGREEYRRVFGAGDDITVHPSSAMKLGYLPRYIVAGEIMSNASGFTGAFQCQPVELEWLPEVASQLLEKDQYPTQILSRKGHKFGSYRYCSRLDGHYLFSLVEELDPKQFLDFKHSRRKGKKGGKSSSVLQGGLRPSGETVQKAAKSTSSKSGKFKRTKSGKKIRPGGHQRRSRNKIEG